MKNKAKQLITIDGLVMAVCSGILLGTLVHMLFRQAATTLLLIQSLNS